MDGMHGLHGYGYLRSFDLNLYLNLVLKYLKYLKTPQGLLRYLGTYFFPP